MRGLPSRAAAFAATLALTGLGLVGCSGNAVFLELPEDGPAGAVIFVVDRADGDVSAFASARGSAPPLEFALDDGETAQLYAVQYAASLERLGLAPGAVELADPEVCGATPLPTQDALHVRAVGPGGDDAWTRLDDRPTVIERVRVPGDCPCHRFTTVDTQTLPLPAAWLPDGDEAFLLDADGVFGRMDREGRYTVVPGAVRAPVLGLTAGVRAADGQIWLGVDQSLWTGRVDEPFTVTATLTTEGDSFMSLAGGAGPTSFELYAATRTGALLQITPGPPVVLRQPLRVPFNLEHRGRVVWLGPGRVVASEHASADVFWVEDGLESARVTLPATAGGLRFLFRVDDQLFAITNLSDWFRLDRREVEVLPGPRLGTARGVLRFDGGFLTSGDTGYLQEYLLGYGFCPTQQLPGEPRVVGLVPLGDRFLAVSFGAGGSDPQGILLEATPWAAGPL